MGWFKKCKYCQKSMRPTRIRGHVEIEHPDEYEKLYEQLKAYDAPLLPPKPPLRRVRL